MRLGAALSPLVEGLELEQAARALIEAGQAHGTLVIALDDRLVTGCTALVTLIDGFHSSRIQGSEGSVRAGQIDALPVVINMPVSSIGSMAHHHRN
jgi:hypothetical protein